MGGGLEEPEGEALIHPRRCRRGGRAATSPCSGAHRGNRKEGRATREGRGLAQLGSWLGWAEAQVGQRLSLPSAFPFLFPLFQQLLHFLLETNDFSKLCHWPKQFQRIIVHSHKKIVRLLKKFAIFIN